MTATEIQTAYNDAQCYACYGLTQEQILELAELKTWLLTRDPDADTSGANLLETAQCAHCYGASIFDLLEIGLLILIYESL